SFWVFRSGRKGLMEQTLLPDGVRVSPGAERIDSILLRKPLTSVLFRVMYVSRNTQGKETDHDREQKPDHRNPAHGSLPQAESHLRGGGERGKAKLQAGRWTGVQESVSS